MNQEGTNVDGTGSDRRMSEDPTFHTHPLFISEFSSWLRELEAQAANALQRLSIVSSMPTTTTIVQQMEQMSIENLDSPTNLAFFRAKPLPTNSQFVQQKLEEMKELLNNLHTSEMEKKTLESFDLLFHSSPKYDVFEKALDERTEFRRNYIMYEWVLKENICKIETSQFVVFRDLHPLHPRKVPKLIDFTKYIVEKKDEVDRCSECGQRAINLEY